MEHEIVPDANAFDPFMLFHPCAGPEVYMLGWDGSV